MSIEALLTVMTIVLAVFALIPQERSQDLRVRFGGIVVWVVGVIAVLVVYWALLEQVHSLPGIRGIPRPFEWLPTWGPASLSLVALLLAMAVALWHFRRRLPVGRVPRLASAIADGIARRRYGECMHLIDMHLDGIRSALDGEYWQARWREALFPSASELHFRAFANDRGKKASPVAGRVVPLWATRVGGGLVGSFRSLLRRKGWFGGFTQRVIDHAERPRDSAHDLVRMISQSPGFVAECASTNPHLGLRLLQLNSSWVARDFAETFAEALHQDPQSVLYRELRWADNFIVRGMPLVSPTEQPLLAALCADAVQPHGPRLLYTFLQCGIASVRWNRPPATRDLLNGPLEDYPERGRWTSPPYASVYLMAVIAPRVAAAPNAPLLNLYDLHTLTSTIIDKMLDAFDSDARVEWPTPGHYLLAEIVSQLRGLVRILKDRVTTEGEASGFVPKEDDHSTVPNHAIHVLGAVMRTCMLSGRLSVPFKAHLLEMWWDVYSKKYEGDWAGSGLVLDALVNGGTRASVGRPEHRAGVASALDLIDYPIRYSDAAKRLRERFDLSTS